MVFNDACLKLPDATLRSTWFFWSISAWKENYSFVKLVLVPAVALWIFSRPIIYHNLSSHHLFRNHITKRAYTNPINIVIISIKLTPHHHISTSRLPTAQAPSLQKPSQAYIDTQYCHYIRRRCNIRSARRVISCHTPYTHGHFIYLRF